MKEFQTLKKIRNKNLSDILQVLRKYGECSLAQLTENTEGGLTTVKKCVNEALELNMIKEGDMADSTGGRKAKLYLINPEYQYFLFLIVDNNNLICEIYDFSYILVKDYKISFEMNGFTDCVYEVVGKAKEEFKIGTVCLSLPCVVKNGIVMDWYYNRSAEGLDLKKSLQEKFGVNVIVQNDMKLTVIGESVQNGKSIKNIATVQFGHNGIGVGEMVNGQVITGNAGFAGEVGYTDDLRKNIMGISFPAKIVRNIIIYTNPEYIVFYKSERQNDFERIFNSAVRNLPDYALPQYKVSDDYFGSIIRGFILMVNKCGYFRISEGKNEQYTEK